jgi:hypothetical protein
LFDGISEPNPGAACDADTNNDGFVNVQDLMEVPPAGLVSPPVM